MYSIFPSIKDVSNPIDRLIAVTLLYKYRRNDSHRLVKEKKCKKHTCHIRLHTDALILHGEQEMLITRSTIVSVANLRKIRILFFRFIDRRKSKRIL